MQIWGGSSPPSGRASSHKPSAISYDLVCVCAVTVLGSADQSSGDCGLQRPVDTAAHQGQPERWLLPLPSSPPKGTSALPQLKALWFSHRECRASDLPHRTLEFVERRISTRSFFISFLIGDISSQLMSHCRQLYPLEPNSCHLKKNVLTPVGVPDCLNPAQKEHEHPRKAEREMGLLRKGHNNWLPAKWSALKHAYK